MNTGVHRLFWIGVSGFLGYNPSGGIAGSKGSSIFGFLRKFHIFKIMMTVVIITVAIVMMMVMDTVQCIRHSIKN